jgi:hypothetical protein
VDGRIEKKAAERGNHPDLAVREIDERSQPR